MPYIKLQFYHEYGVSEYDAVLMKTSALEKPVVSKLRT